MITIRDVRRRQGDRRTVAQRGVRPRADPRLHVVRRVRTSAAIQDVLSIRFGVVNQMKTSSDGRVGEDGILPAVPPPESEALKLYEWGVVTLTLGLLLVGCALYEPIDAHSALVMIPWLLLVSVAELLPVLYLPDLTL